MNILLSMPNDGQSNNYIINALHNLGHKVFFIDHRAHLKEAKELVSVILQNEKIDLMLTLFLNPQRTYNVLDLRNFKAASPQTKFCAWIFDATLDQKEIPDHLDLLKNLREYDYFFTVCRGHVEKLRERGVNAYFLQEGADAFTIAFEDDLPYKHDVSFIGQVGHPHVHQERLPLLKKIISRFDNTIIYGPLYVKDEQIFDHHAKRPTYNDIEHSRIVRESKINIGHSGWNHIDGYFSARNYRIMIAGGFLLANYSPGMEEFFEIGKEIAVYKDQKECLEKIKYYLKNEEERHAIRKAGRKRVMENYTFDHSLQKMFGIVGE